jgi:hypothetical protein
MGIKKDTDLVLNLTAEEVNLVLDGLVNLPYKNVYHVIDKIRNQVISETHLKNQETSRKVK